MITLPSMFSRCLLLLLFAAAPILGAAETGHPLRGVVTRVLAEQKLVMVQHEAIPGFMRAMTMAFNVDDAVLPQLTPGTHLTATMQGTRGDWHLENVQLTDENWQPLPVSSAGSYTLSPLTNPAGPGAMGSSLVRTSGGSVYLSWLQPAADNVTALCFARFDSTTGNWGQRHVIAQGSDWFDSHADFPALTAQDNGHLAAVWFVNSPASAHAAAAGTGHHHVSNFTAWFRQSTNAGATWSPPALLTQESDAAEFVSVQALADGRVLAAWLDGRDKPAGNPTRLYARILGANGPDMLVDDSVCDCCHTELTAFPDGSALLIYRARRAGEVRDIYTARFHHDHWASPHILSNDDWHINGCPVNGPQLASHGGNVSAAWFTAADNDPRVLASASPDAGARFTLALRIDEGHPLGRVDTLLLRDGSRLVTWVEGGEANEAGLYLRRISPADELNPPVLLATTKVAAIVGFPRIALLKDYDSSPAQILVTYTREGASGGIETLRVTLPDLSALAGRKPCIPCDEQDASATRGYPVKGVITAVRSSFVVLKYEEIPGVMRAGAMDFRVEPVMQAKLQIGTELLGRIEKRDRSWWLFKLRLLGAPATANNH